MKKLQCKCCRDKICKKGNCLCIVCMKRNLEKNKIKKGNLINKKGRICYKNNDNKYYCGYKNCIEETPTSNGKKLISFICQFPENCKDCQDLTANCKIYEKCLK